MHWVRPIRLGILYFGIIFAVGLVLGTVRVLLIAPLVGEMWAVALELPVMLVAAWLVCGRLVRGQGLTFGKAGIMGAVAFGLLMVGEAAISIGLAGRTLSEHFALYAEPAHILGLAGQIAFAAFPALRR